MTLPVYGAGRYEVLLFSPEKLHILFHPSNFEEVSVLTTL